MDCEYCSGYGEVSVMINYEEHMEEDCEQIFENQPCIYCGGTGSKLLKLPREDK